MKQQVTIQAILPEGERTNPNGGSYPIQDVVLAWQEVTEDGMQAEQRVLVTLMGDHQLDFKSRSYQIGDQMEAELSFRVMTNNRTLRPFNSVNVKFI